MIGDDDWRRTGGGVRVRVGFASSDCGSHAYAGARITVVPEIGDAWLAVRFVVRYSSVYTLISARAEPPRYSRRRLALGLRGIAFGPPTVPGAQE